MTSAVKTPRLQGMIAVLSLGEPVPSAKLKELAGGTSALTTQIARLRGKGYVIDYAKGQYTLRGWPLPKRRSE